MPAHLELRTATAPQPDLSGGFDPSRDYVRMVLRDLLVYVRVGLHPWEHRGPQQLVVNVEAWAAAGDRYTDADVGRIIDYDRIRELIQQEWPQRPHCRLIEPLAEELIAACFALPGVEAARVRIEKPDIFPEAKGAGIEIFRRKNPKA